MWKSKLLLTILKVCRIALFIGSGSLGEWLSLNDYGSKYYFRYGDDVLKYYNDSELSKYDEYKADVLQMRNLSSCDCCSGNCHYDLICEARIDTFEGDPLVGFKTGSLGTFSLVGYFILEISNILDSIIRRSKLRVPQLRMADRHFCVRAAFCYFCWILIIAKPINYSGGSKFLGTMFSFLTQLLGQVTLSKLTAKNGNFWFDHTTHIIAEPHCIKKRRYYLYIDHKGLPYIMYSTLPYRCHDLAHGLLFYGFPRHQSSNNSISEFFIECLDCYHRCL